MIKEDDNFVLYGPKITELVPNESLGKIMYESFCEKDFDLNKPAMIDAFSGKSISYQTILYKSCAIAEALRKLGCDTETVVSIISENNLEYFIPVLASIFVGSMVSTVNFSYTAEEMKHVLNITQAKVVFVSKDAAETFLKIKDNFKFIDKIIVFNSEIHIKGTQTIKEFINEQLGVEKINFKNFKPWNGDLSKPILLLSSSGTTGLPKCVMITHRNMACKIAQSRHSSQNYNLPNGTVSGLLPFFHAFGLVMGITSLVNKTVVIMFRKFDEDIFLNAIETYKINLLIIAPPIAIFLAKTPKANKYDLSSVRYVLCGAAPLSKHIEAALSQRLKIEGIQQGYGLTETTLGVSRIAINKIRSGSSGTVMPGTIVKVRDPETGHSLGPNQVGEICAKGLPIMKGYYKNDKATKETFTSDGWLRTGDLGYYDKDGYFYIVDRLKELIKYKGYQVAPAELEAILINHPKVSDVGVVGLPDELAGELPIAFVVKKTSDVTEKELQQYVAEKVSPQKRLRGGVIFVPSIPKNPSGKILRRELRLKAKNLKGLQDSKL